MFDWRISRPFAVFDIESTGANPRNDRLIDLAIIKITPAGTREVHIFRVNPQMPIPPEATAIHGITDGDVADCPIFCDVASRVVDVLDGCDLGGFNIVRFDIPLLIAEFQRCNVVFDAENRRIIDAQRIFHRREPRNLAAALAFYCQEEHVNAHGAEADAVATIQVLEGQFGMYSDLPRDFDDLDLYCNPRDPSWADRSGRLRWSNGEVVLNFGKKSGQPLRRLAAEDPGFLLPGNAVMGRVLDAPASWMTRFENALEGG